jgi:hypothetical protein
VHVLYLLLSRILQAGLVHYYVCYMRLRDLAWLGPALYVVFKCWVSLVATFVTWEEISGVGLIGGLLEAHGTEGFHMNAPNGIGIVFFDEEL